MSPPQRAPNRLARESSPYLQQHAQNPVDWYPWGDEAFDKARAEDRPIFLSVGYSSCHWCHVMERESFEDEEVARLLNEGFVSIKVDREERPDVDAIYMSSVQLLTGQGGWPMSVFLTPELKPFYGGTYFPRDSMYGRPGFIDVLRHLSRVYHEERPKVDRAAAQIAERLSSIDLVPGGDAAPGLRDLEAAFRHAAQSYDSTFGGFGGAPKFPHAQDLAVLLRYWKRSGERLALDMALFTLRKMAEGGIYDQIGGGFHRYSVDRQWLVPHFEKMLYDNALLAPVYFEAAQVTADSFYRRIGCEILDYVLREMTSPEGGFYAATDADSEGVEGKFFVWTPEEVEAVLGPDRGRMVTLYYDVTVGGNFEDGASILHVTRPVEALAAALKMPAADLEAVLDESKKALYEARRARVPPFRDQKVIASWNGLMLSAFARGHQATGDDRYLAAAERSAGFIESNLIRGDVLFRIWKDGEVRVPGFAEDYAYLAAAFLDLYEASFAPRWLDRARWLVDRLLAEFGEAGGKGFYYSSDRHAHLIHRRKDFVDNATPAANWVAALALVRLSALSGEAAWRGRAESILAGLGEWVERMPMGFATALVAVDFLLGPPLEIAVVGDLDAEETRRLLRAIHRRFLPNKVLAGAPGEADAELAAKLPLLRGRGRADGRAAVYLCENFSCRAPISDVAALDSALDGLARSAT
jgi:hypothetical protein